VMLEREKGCVLMHVERRHVAASPRLARFLMSSTKWRAAVRGTAVHASCASRDAPQGRNQESQCLVFTLSLSLKSPRTGKQTFLLV